MKEFNNKGFTLVELLAVIAILGIISAITVPTVTHIINKNKEDNYENLKKSIISAAKIYMSDNRDNFKLVGSCSDNNIQIKKVGDDSSFGGVTIGDLISDRELKANNGKIVDPRDKSKFIDLNKNKVIISYDCEIKDYTYELNPDNLINN